MARIAPQGFREYDVRWRYPDEIDLPGLTRLGQGIGAQLARRGIPEIAVGHDLRSYAPAVAEALIQGLLTAGARVEEIGLALSPMMYFAYGALPVGAIAMVTASHNPNGWTGVKIGMEPPLTHGTEDMAELRQIVLEAPPLVAKTPGTRLTGRGDALRAAYLDDLAEGRALSRPLRVVCATGNGTAGAFAPHLLARMGATVLPRHTALDPSFPHYNPNPEGHEMLADMAAAIAETGADLALGFDGDGDRCGVIDNEGEEISSDKMGVLLARRLAETHPNARFVADVKSTGLFQADPELTRLGAKTEYWKTGHSHLKRRLAETGALAGFERSGHYYLAPPVGRGYDCGLRAAVEILALLDAKPDQSLAALRRSLPETWLTPPYAPAASDAEKYAIIADLTAVLRARAAAGGTLGGHAITEIMTVNGVRASLAHGGFALLRASSNTPNLVVLCESPISATDRDAILADLQSLTRSDPRIADWTP